MTDRLLVVNADDFGLSPGVSRGILDAHRIGVVTSTSAMVTLSSWSATSRLLRSAASTLGVGLHFDVLAGRPLVTRSSLVAGTTGQFHSYQQLLRRIVSGRITRLDVEHECDAQIARLRAELAEGGADITHIDSHRHTHMLPVLAAGLRRSAARAGIDIIRFPAERFTAGNRNAGRARVAALRVLSMFQPSASASRDRGFLGAAWQGSSNFASHLLRIADYLHAPVTELMCHPGYVDDELRQIDGFTEHRQRELGALRRSGLRAEWERSGIRLVSFGDIGRGSGRKAPELDEDNDPHHEAWDRADAVR